MLCYVMLCYVIITNVIFTNQHFTLTILMQINYSNITDELQVLHSFPALLPERPGELARRLFFTLK